MTDLIMFGDCVELLKFYADNGFRAQTCVTSPPYFGLRDYGHDGQIGLEQTPEEYAAKLVEVFREVKRVLRDDGTLFLNLGDSYCSANNEPLFCLREDCSLEVARDVGLEVFGLRIDGSEAPGQGPLPEVLSGGDEGQTLCGGPDLAGQGEQAFVRTEPRGSHSEDDRPQQANEGQSDGLAWGQVRLLRGDASAISDDRPHSRRRGGASEGADGQEPSIIGPHLSGHSQTGMPAGSVPSSLLELQLRDRIVRILSAWQFAAADIPHRLKQYFRPVGLKPKDLIGIPWRVAFALQADGWYLRQEIIWAKPNPMPESVKDRCTKSHEQIFLLSKSAKYYFDHEAIKEPVAESSKSRLAQNVAEQHGSDRVPGKTNGPMKAVGNSETRNKRDVWTVATRPFKGAHFATFPPELIEPCVLAGAPAGGVVLDPFMGSGTTAMVAKRNGRAYLGCELNPEYEPLIEERLK